MSDAYPTPPPTPSTAASYESDYEWDDEVEDIVIVPRFLLPLLRRAIEDEEIGTPWAYHSCTRSACLLCASRRKD